MRHAAASDPWFQWWLKLEDHRTFLYHLCRCHSQECDDGLESPLDDYDTFYHIDHFRVVSASYAKSFHEKCSRGGEYFNDEAPPRFEEEESQLDMVPAAERPFGPQRGRGVKRDRGRGRAPSKRKVEEDLEASERQEPPISVAWQCRSGYVIDLSAADASEFGDAERRRELIR